MRHFRTSYSWALDNHSTGMVNPLKSFIPQIVHKMLIQAASREAWSLDRTWCCWLDAGLYNHDHVFILPIWFCAFASMHAHICCSATSSAGFNVITIFLLSSRPSSATFSSETFSLWRNGMSRRAMPSSPLCKHYVEYAVKYNCWDESDQIRWVVTRRRTSHSTTSWIWIYWIMLPSVGANSQILMVLTSSTHIPTGLRQRFRWRNMS